MNTEKINRLRDILKENNHKFFGVTFIKKDGTERTLNGHMRYVEGHDLDNPVAHIPKYVTVVLPKKDSNGQAQFRNVNLETVKCININKNIYTF